MVEVAERPQSLSLLAVASRVKGLFFYKWWKLSLTKGRYIIPGNLRRLHCGGCLKPIMRSLNNAVKKGNRSCLTFPLSTGLAILGIQGIIVVSKTILKHLNRSMKSALKGNMAFSDLMWERWSIAIPGPDLVSCVDSKGLFPKQLTQVLSLKCG